MTKREKMIRKPTSRFNSKLHKKTSLKVRRKDRKKTETRYNLRFFRGGFFMIFNQV